MNETILEKELYQCLAGVMNLIDNRELIRNTNADGQDDWVQRMAALVSVLKRAQLAMEQYEKESAQR